MTTSGCFALHVESYINPSPRVKLIKQQPHSGAAVVTSFVKWCGHQPSLLFRRLPFQKLPFQAFPFQTLL